MNLRKPISSSGLCDRIAIRMSFWHTRCFNFTQISESIQAGRGLRKSYTGNFAVARLHITPLRRAEGEPTSTLVTKHGIVAHVVDLPLPLALWVGGPNFLGGIASPKACRLFCCAC